MNHKFQYKVCKGQIIEMDWDRFKELHRGLPDGDYDLIQRKQIKWDTEAMRKFFHGPVRQFIVQEFRKQGASVSKEQVKEYLKGEFGPDVNPGVAGVPSFPKSTADYTYEEYKELLMGTKVWCINTFDCELPSAEEVE